jgi:hypothetical protein
MGIGMDVLLLAMTVVARAAPPRMVGSFSHSVYNGNGLSIGQPIKEFYQTVPA